MKGNFLNMFGHLIHLQIHNFGNYQDFTAEPEPSTNYYFKVAADCLLPLVATVIAIITSLILILLLLLLK